MARLVDGLSRLFERVEIFARGAEEERRAAERALASGDALEARAQARALLARVPGSPLGLALWADAAEACLRHDEVVEALTALATKVPWRHEVWLRLGLARLGDAPAEARDALERAARAGATDPGVARDALVALADLDLASGDPARALRWIDRVPTHAAAPDPELALRRAEAWLGLGAVEEAARLAPLLAFASEDPRGRFRLVRARLALSGGDEQQAHALALGAFVLEAPGAEALLVRLARGSRDGARLARIRAAVVAAGRDGAAAWRAAFALAEGHPDVARKALFEASVGGDVEAARSLLALATEERDLGTLRALGERWPELVPPALGTLLEASAHAAAGRGEEALESLETVGAEAGVASEWAHEVAREVVRGWTREAVADWPAILAELGRASSRLGALACVAGIEGLAVERTRPLSVAVLGEFNAGKSTFINALLGTDVAPTGIAPTTAILHHVAWAPDPFARVLVRGGPDRVVPHDALKRALAELRDEGQRVERVLIYAPFERLKRIELLDTPGFNAPDTDHAVEARRGVEEAHVALWLLDATAPLRETERAVIADIAKAGVPVQIVANKRDRLAPGELERVMRYIEQSLSEVGLASLGAPVALSARQALAGRLGDPQALAASGWAELERLLAEEIVDRSEVLREGALRRKAAGLAGALSARARARAAEAEGARRERLEQAALSGRIASWLEANRARVAARALGASQGALALLAADLRPLEELGPEGQRDGEARDYVVERARARLVPALAEAVEAAGREELGGSPAAEPWPAAREVGRALRLGVATAVAVHGIGLPADESALLAAVEEGLRAAAEALLAGAATPPPHGAEDALARRLEALAQALRSLPR
jgi:GTP-binding protein EngB required for normal cell division